MVSGIEVHVEMRAKMQHKVSVIVPVYNAEDFLAECIESILGQDYEELELLLVDDGSRDGSGRICEEYAAASGKIRLLRQENSGASAARNAGLRQAEGEFIVFVDADDYLPGTDIVSHMVCEIEAAPADVLVGDYERLWDGRLAGSRRMGGLSVFKVFFQWERSLTYGAKCTGGRSWNVTVYSFRNFSMAKISCLISNAISRGQSTRSCNSRYMSTGKMNARFPMLSAGILWKGGWGLPTGQSGSCVKRDLGKNTGIWSPARFFLPHFSTEKCIINLEGKNCPV